MKFLGFQATLITLYLFVICYENHGINGQVIVITQPHNTTGCIGGTAMFTCVMNVTVNISTVDIKWWRRRYDDPSFPLLISTQGTNVFSITSNISGGVLTSVLMITSLRLAFIGSYWLEVTDSMQSSDMVFLSIVPSAPVNIRFPPPSVTDVSFIVQWDAVINQSVDTYVVSVHWTDDRYKYRTQSVTVHGTSYTVTGLTPNTTYIVSVVAVDESGCNGLASDGEEVTTTVSVSMDTTSTINTSSINPTVTTVTTDNSITINTTINSDTKLVPTLDVTVTSNFIPNMIATNPVDTTGLSTTFEASANVSFDTGLGDKESDGSGSDSLSTGVLVVITFAVTFIVSVTATAIITFIVAYVCAKRTFEKASVINTPNPIGVSPPEKVLYEMVGPPTHTVTKDDLEMQRNPAYDLSHKVAMDTNPAYESCK